MLLRFMAARWTTRLAMAATPFLIILIPMFRLASVTVLQAQGQQGSAQNVEVEGELEVEIEDSAAGSRIHHFVKVNGKRLRLALSDQGGDWQSGTRVRARGRLSNDTLELGSGGSVQTLALASSNTFGQQRVAVILVNFRNNMTQPYTASFVNGVTFDETNRWYQENSYGQTSLTGEVFGWFTLPIDVPGSCTSTDYNNIASQADQVATANGVNLGQFTRKIYAFPQVGACGWWGLGSVGGNPSRAWINGSYALKVVAHELGHNFGDYHSNSQPCSTGGCSITEYGDDRDMMGMSSIGHFTAFQKERLGWLNYGTSPPIQNVTTSGTYWIEAYGTAPNGGPKALRLLKSTDANGYRTWYYIESRARLGFDNGFAAGVTVHTASENNGRSSYQIDLAPSTDAFDSLLDPGQLFADASLDLAIRTVSASDAGAFVEFTFPGAPCSSAAPTVTVSPGSASTVVGTPVSLSVSVRNNDAGGCSATTFALSVTTPNGWPASYTAASLNVAPGATATTTLSVAPSSAGSGSVTNAASRTNTSGPGGSGSATVSATAPTQCTAAAPTVTLSPGTVTTATGAPVSLNVTVRNNDSTSGCASTTFDLSHTIPSGWSGSFSQATLAVAPGSSATSMLTVTPSTTTGGTVTAAATRSGSTGPGGSGSATVSIASSLNLSLSIVKTNSYQISATVTAGGPVSGSSVKFAVRSPTGSVTNYSATTNSLGVAKIAVRLKGKDPRGTYAVDATVTSGALVGSASGSFTY
jgi:hypothetical protein